MKKIQFVLVVFVFALSLTAWATLKPIRVLAPSWVENISCINSTICIDDKSRYSEALELYDNALDVVSESAGKFKNKPVMIFCTKLDCFQSFGFNKAAGQTVGKSGIIISPRGWKPHYIRHEMIHYRQAEELGVLGSFFKPEWFIEGMAYSLSNDPREKLSDRWQKSRSKFDYWLSVVEKDNLWQEAIKL